MYNNYKIAVTGGTGFVGEQLVPELIQQGMEVALLTRNYISEKTIPSANYYKGDILDKTSLSPFVKDSEIVMHLAGYAHVTNGLDASEIDMHRIINFEGTKNIFTAALHADVRRFIYVSSVKAGGEHSVDCLDEMHSRTPQEPYGLIKRQTEDWLFEASRGTGIELSIIRPALVYGPGVKGNLAAMLRGIDRGWFPPIPETHNRRSMVSIYDVVSALISAAIQPQAVGRVFILTDDEVYSTRRIYTAMAVALGKNVPDWTVPVRLIRNLGRIGECAQRLTKAQIPINNKAVSRLLDSACYKSIFAKDVLGFRALHRLEDILPDMVRTYRLVQNTRNGMLK